MAELIIGFLFILTLYTTLHVLMKIFRQQKHLDDETLRKVVTTEIRHESNYDDVIGHLGICRKCQKRLDEISRE